MPFCPDCHEEYRAGFTTCADCGAALVEEPPITQPEPIIETRAEYFSPAFLCSATHGFSSDLLICALKEAGIPTQVKHRGSGEFLTIFMGASGQGMDIFVPSDMLQKARDIMANVTGETQVYEETGSIAEMQKTSHSKPIKGWILIALFLGVPGLILLVIYWLLR